jgi:hypothetical protein
VDLGHGDLGLYIWGSLNVVLCWLILFFSSREAGLFAVEVLEYYFILASFCLICFCSYGVLAWWFFLPLIVFCFYLLFKWWVSGCLHFLYPFVLNSIWFYFVYIILYMTLKKVITPAYKITWLFVISNYYLILMILFTNKFLIYYQLWIYLVHIIDQIF